MSLPKHFENKFEILHKLSEGGMGEVYKVRHLLLDQVQVIKVIRPQHEDDESHRQRFQREAQTAIRLRHRNIAVMYDFSIGEGGTAYIVMEYIEGETLYEILQKRGPFSVDLAIDIARQSLEALDYLHGEGYLHRDVSPDNLMLTHESDGSPLVKLIDLGLAKQIGGGHDLTTTGMFVGKARYSSPEQLRGETTDQRSDIYSFGVMLYQLLTGVVPIEGDNVTTLLAGHLFRPPLAFERSDPEGRVPEELRQVVMRTLEKDPDERVASAAELLSLLEPLDRQCAATIHMAAARAPAPAKTAAPVASAEALAGDAAVRTELAARRRRSWRRPLLAAVAAVAAVAAGVGAWRGLRPRTVVEPAWQEHYRLAVEQLADGDLQGVPALLRRARDAHPTAAADPRWAAPGQEGPYLPYFFLGQAHFRQNNCVEALEAWDESERQGIVRTTPYYSELVDGRARCQALFADAVERLAEALAGSAGSADLLAGALENSAFAALWRHAPELAEDARAAVAKLAELQVAFAAARAEQRFDDVLGLESEVVDAGERLDRILSRLSELTAPAAGPQ